MGGVIDTNLLLYAANRDAEEHNAAAGFLRQAAASAEQWFLTEGIVYEFLRVSTHARVFPSPLSWKEALSFLKPLLEAPGFIILTAGFQIESTGYSFKNILALRRGKETSFDFTPVTGIESRQTAKLPQG